MASLFSRKSKEKLSVPMGKAASMSMSKSASSMMQSISKQRSPLDYLRTKGIVTDETETDLKETWELCRKYCKYTDLIPMIITIYANFPLQGMRISCKDEKTQDIFDKQFMDSEGLNYPEYLPELGKEFFKIGEVNSFAIFDYESKWWISEEILNPNDISVQPSIFAGEEQISLKVSDSLKDAFGHFGSAEQQYLDETYPDLADAVRNNRDVIINSDFIYRIVEKAEPWDNRGTPIMLRAFEPLLQMETLNAAQDAIADRLYSPLILARLGIPASEMGPDQSPWIPTQEQLDSFATVFDQALAADYRALIHHFGIDIRSVFGRESMPRLDNDFDRLERRIMRAFGIGQGLLDGSNQGAYASSAINRDFVSQLMATYQRQIQSLFHARARLFSESRGIYETFIADDGKEQVKMEEYAAEDEDGKVVMKQKPVVYVPSLVFSSNPLRDASFEMNLLNAMRSAGVPISDKTLMEASTLDLDFEEELGRIKEEEVNKKTFELSTTEALKEKLKGMGFETDMQSVQETNEETEALASDAGNAETVEQETNTYKPSKELS